MLSIPFLCDIDRRNSLNEIVTVFETSEQICSIRQGRGNQEAPLKTPCVTTDCEPSLAYVRDFELTRQQTERSLDFRRDPSSARAIAFSADPPENKNWNSSLPSYNTHETMHGTSLMHSITS